MRPFGYFVHHQGRGHAERCAAIVNALPPSRPVTIFCARDDIFPRLPPSAEIVRIPSLFEAEQPGPAALGTARTPVTMHCAPLGWSSIRDAMARMSGWWASADPALMIVDVSAEVAQLARLCSVPVVKVLQHGDRSDPGHLAAYESAAGILAPYDIRLEQPERPDWMRAITHHAGGLGLRERTLPAREAARRVLGVPDGMDVCTVISGGGGSGAPLAPLTMAARAMPGTRFHVIGEVAREWHETVPGNLVLHGWVDTPDAFFAAADIFVASTGNTTCHQILSTGSPWVAIPEWRYFAEQLEKGRALERAGVAHLEETWPATPQRWAEAFAAARRRDSELSRSMIDPHAAEGTALWLEDLAERLWLGGSGSRSIAAE